MFPTVCRIACVLTPPPRNAAPPMSPRAPTPRSTEPAAATPAPRFGLTMLSAGDMYSKLPSTLLPGYDAPPVTFSPSRRSPFPRLFSIIGIDDEKL